MEPNGAVECYSYSYPPHKNILFVLTGAVRVEQRGVDILPSTMSLASYAVVHAYLADGDNPAALRCRRTAAAGKATNT